MVRLVGGPVEYMGRVEVYDRESDQWGTVCYNDVFDEFASTELVCKSIFGTYSFTAHGPASFSSNIQPSTNNPIVNGWIDCGYYSRVYDHFYQCPSLPLDPIEAMSRCTPDQEWVVVCRGKLYYNTYTSIYTVYTSMISIITK